ncbi:hypothetical protein ACFLZP_03275 [Patescibacteria group bacterium]
MSAKKLIALGVVVLLVVGLVLVALWQGGVFDPANADKALADAAAALTREPEPTEEPTEEPTAQGTPRVAPATPTPQATRPIQIIGSINDIERANLPDLEVVSSEPGVPFNGDTMNMTLEKGMVGLYTTGPCSVTAKSGDISLPGGSVSPPHGSTIVFAHTLETPQRFQVNAVVPSGGWYAKIKVPEGVEIEDVAKAVGQIGAEAMADPANGNCTGNGCPIVDVLVILRDKTGDSLIARDTLSQTVLYQPTPAPTPTKVK